MAQAAVSPIVYLPVDAVCSDNPRVITVFFYVTAFAVSQATADQRRQEAEDKHLEREKQKTEKEDRAKKRRKQHALLSKRTRGGQPVMKHTIQHLLEKIQSQG